MPNKGYKQSEEHKGKISKKLKGIERKPCSKEKMEEIFNKKLKISKYNSLSKEEKKMLETKRIRDIVENKYYSWDEYNKLDFSQ